MSKTRVCALACLRVPDARLNWVAGTLLKGVVIGRLGVAIDPGIKAIVLALFIYAIGVQGCP